MFTMKWVAGAAMLACTGALVACGDGADRAGTAAGTPTPTGAVTSTPTPTAGAPAPSSTPTTVADRLLAGKREVTITRVQGSGSALELSGRLEEGGDTGGACCSCRRRSAGTST
ncbi:hypothetical protein NKG94_49810 [Micromonospora sp. M12]